MAATSIHLELESWREMPVVLGKTCIQSSDHDWTPKNLRVFQYLLNSYFRIPVSSPFSLPQLSPWSISLSNILGILCLQASYFFSYCQPIINVSHTISLEMSTFSFESGQAISWAPASLTT